jgi:hypothetical protein
MTRCSHGIRYEDRCNRCVEEGVARANGVAMQTPGPVNPVNVDGCSASNMDALERWAKMGANIAPRVFQSDIDAVMKHTDFRGYMDPT